MADTDKAKTPNERRKLPGDIEERKVRALEQIASTLGTCALNPRGPDLLISREKALLTTRAG